MLLIDPMQLKNRLWPSIVFSREQQEIIYSVEDNDETVVPAANMLGKDFVAAFIVIAYFLRRHPCKIVTTSVKDKHLDVLWGEVEKLVRISSSPLTIDKGGPLSINADGMRKVVGGKIQKDSYVMKLVASDKTMESFQGHHVTPDPTDPAAYDNLPRNLFVVDEASGVPDAYYKMADTWAKRKLIFGNPWTCNNFFYRAVKGDRETGDQGGDLPRLTGVGLSRKVIKITGEDSPNVRYAREEEAEGLPVSGRVVVPGMLTYEEYLDRRRKWDKVKQCVSLDAEFYEGEDVLMYPPEWLNYANQLAIRLRGIYRRAKAIGIDTGEGSADTALCAVDDLGIIELVTEKTVDAGALPGKVLAFMRKHGVPPEKVMLDRGGGGYWIAGALRKLGYNVQTVAFGTAIAAAIRPRGVINPLAVRKDIDEERYAYKNRRAEMYGMLRQRLECTQEENLLRPIMGQGFAIPQEYKELRRQLAPVRLWYDEEGRIYLPPKDQKSGDKENADKVTMKKLLGCSPDQSDALVLAVYGMTVKTHIFKAKSMV